MNMNILKFTVPVLGDNTQQLYSKLYGDNGVSFINILSSSPYEIAVISRLIAYLAQKKRGNDYDGCTENS